MEKEFLFDLNDLSTKDLLQSFINTASVSSTALTDITGILLRRLFADSQELWKENEKLKQEIMILKQKNPVAFHPNRGRKQKEFYLDNALITDEQLIYLIDGEYYTLAKLEKEVGASKNQLRNRYNRAKKKKASDKPCQL